jgi:copper chaperone NosL
MVQEVASGSIAEAQVGSWWVCDHAHPGTFIDATKAFYLHASTLKSPMNGNTAAFATDADREQAMRTEQGDAMDWMQARARLTDH